MKSKISFSRKKIFLSILFLSIISTIFASSQKAYDNLLEWGLNHSLIISDKIKFVYRNDWNKTYYAKNLIPENETIMEIPYDTMLSIDNSFDLFKNKRFKQLYNRYKILDIDNAFHEVCDFHLK